MIKIGDVVRLVGTNMKMTVETVSPRLVDVVWFDRDDKLNRYRFYRFEIEKI